MRRLMFLMIGVFLMLSLWTMFIPGAWASPLVGQDQQQQQQQQQQTSSNAGAIASPENKLTIQSSRASLQSPDVNPQYINVLQNGKMGDITALMPKFANPALTPLQREDVYTKDDKGKFILVKEADIVEEVLDVYDGYIPSRIKYNEVEYLALKYAKNYKGKDDIRYSVKYKDASWGVGSQGSASAVGTGNDSLTTGGIAGLIGIGKATYDPDCWITFYKVKKRK